MQEKKHELIISEYNNLLKIYKDLLKTKQKLIDQIINNRSLIKTISLENISKIFPSNLKPIHHCLNNEFIIKKHLKKIYNKLSNIKLTKIPDPLNFNKLKRIHFLPKYILNLRYEIYELKKESDQIYLPFINDMFNCFGDLAHYCIKIIEQFKDVSERVRHRMPLLSENLINDLKRNKNLTLKTRISKNDVDLEDFPVKISYLEENMKTNLDKMFPTFIESKNDPEEYSLIYPEDVVSSEITNNITDILAIQNSINKIPEDLLNETKNNLTNQKADNSSNQKIPEDFLNIPNFNLSNQEINNSANQKIPEDFLNMTNFNLTNQKIKNSTNQKIPEDFLNSKNINLNNQKINNSINQKIPEDFLNISNFNLNNQKPPEDFSNIPNFNLTNQKARNSTNQKIPEDFLNSKNFNLTNNDDLNNQKIPEDFLNIPNFNLTNQKASKSTNQKIPEDFLNIPNFNLTNQKIKNSTNQKIPEDFLNSKNFNLNNQNPIIKISEDPLNRKNTNLANNDNLANQNPDLREKTSKKKDTSNIECTKPISFFNIIDDDPQTIDRISINSNNSLNLLGGLNITEELSSSKEEYIKIKERCLRMQKEFEQLIKDLKDLKLFE